MVPQESHSGRWQGVIHGLTTVDVRNFRTHLVTFGFRESDQMQVFFKAALFLSTGALGSAHTLFNI